jgi:hypothetical protein
MGCVKENGVQVDMVRVDDEVVEIVAGHYKI